MKEKVKTKKINKGEFVSITAKAAGLSVDQMSLALDAILSNIPELAKQGVEISFMNFGKFYVQVHKGHPVRFGKDRKNIEDYPVFKFSPSNVLSEKLRDCDIAHKQ